jgi:hypothetical protein
MLDYLPLLVTFALALIGLILRTTHDEPKSTLIKKLTLPGWFVAGFLLVALLMGTANTYLRRKAEVASRLIQSQQTFRDSVTWAAARAVQDTALQEARAIARGQIVLLDSSVSASGALVNQLQQQAIEFRANLHTQQRLLQREADRLRNSISAPRVSIRVVFPPLKLTQGIVLAELSRHSGSDMQADSAATWIQGVRTYRDQFVLNGSEIRFLAPEAFYAQMWPSRDGDCAQDPWSGPIFTMMIRTASSNQWSERWIDREGRLHITLIEAVADTRQIGLESLSDLRNGCFGITPTLRHGLSILGERREVEDLGITALYDELWRGSHLEYVEFDFGNGRSVWTNVEDEAKWPYLGRVPEVLPWERPFHQGLQRLFVQLGLGDPLCDFADRDDC